MGILHNREELIPVTCAVLSDEDRREFFGKVRRKAGKTERIAQACAVTPGVVADWMSGKSLVPYHALMRMSQEFEVDAPQVTELRREYQPVVQTLPSPRPAPPPPARREREPSAADAEGRRAPRREESGRSSRKGENRRGERSSQRRETARSAGPERGRGNRPPRKDPSAPKAPRTERGRGRQTPERKPKPEGKVPSGRTKYSDRLAYWTGALFAAGRRTEDGLRFEADRVIGQNFAAGWARLTEQLFDVKPQLSMTEDHRCQVAFLPADSFKDFEARVELKADAPAPAAPRWTWSNPDWKAAFLRGVVDASAHFHRSPSLNLRGLSEPLRASTQKILQSLSYAPQQKEDGTLLVEGAEAVSKYFETVGTENMKLRDQLGAWKRVRDGEPAREGRGQRGDAPAPASAAAVTASGPAPDPETMLEEPPKPLGIPSSAAESPTQEWVAPKLEQPFAEPAQPFPTALPDASATGDDSY